MPNIAPLSLNWSHIGHEFKNNNVIELFKTNSWFHIRYLFGSACLKCHTIFQICVSPEKKPPISCPLPPIPLTDATCLKVISDAEAPGGITVVQAKQALSHLKTLEKPKSSLVFDIDIDRLVVHRGGKSIFLLYYGVIVSFVDILLTYVHWPRTLTGTSKSGIYIFWLLTPCCAASCDVNHTVSRVNGCDSAWWSTFTKKHLAYSTAYFSWTRVIILSTSKTYAHFTSGALTSVSWKINIVPPRFFLFLLHSYFPVAFLKRA